MSAKSSTVGTSRHNSYSGTSNINPVKTQPINTEGPRRHLTREASDQSLTSSSGELSTGGTPNSVSLLSTSYPPSKSGEALIHSHLKRGSSQDIPIHSHSNHSNIMSRTDTETLQANTSAYSDLPELAHSRPLILQHPSHQPGTTEESSMSWLLDFYPSVFTAASPKDKLIEVQEGFPADQQQESQQSHQHSNGSPTAEHGSSGGPGNSVGLETTSAQPDYNAHTIFRSQEKYMVTLGAPISIAQRMGEDTLTYLNRGQFYSVVCTANLNMSMPERVKTVVYLTFFDEPDKKMEANHWQYWYNLQPNPNQKAFDIDRKNCENLHGKPVDMAYNAASFVWCPEIGAKVVLRINCLSTEFSSQKGVKGIPLHLVTDTYEDTETESAEPVHRAYCKVKIFRDKGAERKNKDETKTVERRMQKLMKQQPGVPLEAEVPASVFHPPNKETILTSTSTFGPKPFLFIPTQQETTASPFSPRVAASAFLASVKERETKRTFSNILKQAKENLDALEVESDQDNGAPPKKSARIPNHRMTTLYVRKEEEKVYHALYLDSLTVHDFKLQVADKYDVHADMIHGVYRKTKKKGLLVHFDDAMISQFQNEDDFIISLIFDNQKGHFDLYIHY